MRREVEANVDLREKSHFLAIRPDPDLQANSSLKYLQCITIFTWIQIATKYVRLHLTSNLQLTYPLLCIYLYLQWHRHRGYMHRQLYCMQDHKSMEIILVIFHEYRGHWEKEYCSSHFQKSSSNTAAGTLRLTSNASAFCLTPSWAPLTAKRSAASLPGSRLCPLIHWNKVFTLSSLRSSILTKIDSTKSRFSTGLLSLVIQLLRRQLTNHTVTQSIAYRLSVKIVTSR